jgi:tellurite resistance protein TehA-like permease
MYVQTYNTVMLLAWCLVSIGAGLIHLPSGLIVAGLGLVAVLLLTFVLDRARFLRPNPSAVKPPEGA